MLVDDVPEAADIGIGGYAFEHQCRRAIGQRAVDDIGVSCYPADISGTPIDVAILIIEYMFMRHCRIQDVSAAGMQHTFWCTRRARGVKDEQWILGIHFNRWAIV